MDAKTYKVKEVARLAGVTVRTLHHYDAIGLVKPSGRTGAGYRLYRDADLLRLQQVLVYREFGMPLEQIRAVLSDPEFDQRTALLEHRERLQAQDRRTQAMLRSVENALRTLEGDETMDPKELFDGFDPAKYEDEVKQRWGDTEAYKESHRRMKNYTKEDIVRMKQENVEILDALAAKLRANTPATDDDVLALAEAHRLHIDRWFYPCSPQMHHGLGQMYVADPRFTATFDKHAEGLAAYLAEAIQAVLERDG